LEEEKKSLELIHDKVDKISVQLENAKLADYFELMRNKKNLIWSNFIVGVVRGFGMAVGFTILGGIIIYFLRYLVLLNLPIIGNFISELVRIVQNNL